MICREQVRLEEDRIRRKRGMRVAQLSEDEVGGWGSGWQGSCLKLE